MADAVDGGGGEVSGGDVGAGELVGVGELAEGRVGVLADEVAGVRVGGWPVDLPMDGNRDVEAGVEEAASLGGGACEGGLSAGERLGAGMSGGGHCGVSVEEAELLARLRSGEDAAYEVLVRAYAPGLLAVARRISRSEADAEDAVQEAFVSAFRAIERFDGRSALGTWLHRIVVNSAITVARRARRGRASSLEGLLPRFQNGRHVERPEAWRLVTPGHAGGVQGADAVRAALADLPDEFREVLVLRDVEGMRSVEIAEALGISDALVRQRVHRGRQALMKLMAPAMKESES